MNRTCPLLIALTCLVRPASAAADPPVSYDAIRAELRASGVPVWLPQPVPARVGPIRSVTVVDVGPAGYVVGFSPVTSCSGGLSCAFFHVAGFRATRGRNSRAIPGERIGLPDGTLARFSAEDCSGAGCTEASLTFRRAGADYEIDVKAGRDDRQILLSAYDHLRRLR